MKKKKRGIQFNDPNIVKEEWGSFSIVAELKSPEKLSKTAVAMDDVAQAEIKNDRDRREGKENYNISFEKLMHAFDAFISEYYKNYQDEKRSAGWDRNYDFSKPCHLTIFIMWQLRNICTHSGGLIDEESAQKYSKAIIKGKENGIDPIIDIPDKLSVGNKFIIPFEDYKSFKQCIFRFIGEKISNEDMVNLASRSRFTDLKFNPPDLIYEIHGYIVAVNVGDLIENGIELDYSQGGISLPEFVCFPKKKKIVFTSSGVSIKVKISKPIKRKDGRKKT